MTASKLLFDFTNKFQNKYRFNPVFNTFVDFMYRLDDYNYLKLNFPNVYKNFFKNNKNCEIKNGDNGYLLFDNEKQKIKLGKFLSSLRQDSTKRKLDKSEIYSIENIVNSYKSWANINNKFKFVELKGREIVTKGYNTRYYYIKMGTLLRSCMNNKKLFIGLYKRNKKKISLLTLQDNNGKIHTRALVWKLDRPFNTILMDRVYYISDYMIDMFQEYAKENGWLYRSNYNTGITNKEYTNYNNKELLQVQLNTWGNIFHPYMDTMIYRTGLDGIFTNKKIFNTKWKMTRTDGLMTRI